MKLSAVLVGNVILWVLFGAVVGLILHLINGNRIKGGVMASIGWGVFGSILGGIASEMLFGKSFVNFDIPGLFLAIIGGVVLALIARIFFKENHYIKTSRTYLQRGEVK